MVYVSEAHGSDAWRIGSKVQIPTHKTLTDRIEAMKMATDAGFVVPCFVDGIDDGVDKALVGWPLKFYIIKKNVLVWEAIPKGGSYDLGEVEKKLMEWI